PGLETECSFLAFNSPNTGTAESAATAEGCHPIVRVDDGELAEYLKSGLVESTRSHESTLSARPVVRQPAEASPRYASPGTGARGRRRIPGSRPRKAKAWPGRAPIGWFPKA